jgi:hypothetical protein
VLPEVGHRELQQRRAVGVRTQQHVAGADLIVPRDQKVDTGAGIAWRTGEAGGASHHAVRDAVHAAAVRREQLEGLPSGRRRLATPLRRADALEPLGRGAGVEQLAAS